LNKACDMMRYGTFLTAATLTLLVCGCDNGDREVAHGASGTSAVNGSLHVPAGEHTGAVGTVNGEVSIDENATVTTVHTVNGSVNLGAHATAESLKAVNGRVTVGDGAHVTGGITTVNGTIRLEGGADVGGTVKNVNGEMILKGARVGGGLVTVGGDIDIAGDSHVEGGIHVENANGGWLGSLFNVHEVRRPRIVIGPGAVVQGDLRFDREVLLYVSDKASIGAVTGATPVRFSGEAPPAG
jgi:DUF4097 and DUF4098 domain-containing protein YvlB